MKIPNHPCAKFSLSFVCRYWTQLFLGLLLGLFFGYIRSQNIDGVEKSYMIPTLATYLATYLTGLSKKK